MTEDNFLEQRKERISLDKRRRYRLEKIAEAILQLE